MRLLFVAYELTMQYKRHRFEVFETHSDGGDSVSLGYATWGWWRGARQQKINRASKWSNIDVKRVGIGITGFCHILPP